MRTTLINRIANTLRGTFAPSVEKDAACSFCRRSYKKVGPLVEGPREVFICRSCVELATSILDQEAARRRQSNN